MCNFVYTHINICIYTERAIFPLSYAKGSNIKEQTTLAIILYQYSEMLPPPLVTFAAN